MEFIQPLPWQSNDWHGVTVLQSDTGDWLTNNNNYYYNIIVTIIIRQPITSVAL